MYHVSETRDRKLISSFRRMTTGDDRTAAAGENRK
jgi:hypothetical protein